MPIAPPCFIPVSAPTGDPQEASIPALSPLTTPDMPNMMAAINGLIHTVNYMNDNVGGGGSSASDGAPGDGIGGGGGNGAHSKKDKKKKKPKKKPQGPTGKHEPEKHGKWKEDKSKRKSTKVRLYNPSDKKQFVDVERIDTFTMNREIPAPIGLRNFIQDARSKPKITETFTWKR